MKAFWAITHLTIRNALRSHVFQLLLGILLIAVIAVPNTINGNGTAQGYIQVALKYSLSSVALLLSLSAVWLGCFSMTHDVEGYQLHQVVTKPVSRITVWMAKWFGVSLVHLILLLLAAAAVYFTVMWRYGMQEFSPEEKARINHEVLVGRRVFRPDTRELREEIDFATDKLRKTQLESKGEVDAGALQALRRTMLSQSQELVYRQTKRWDFSGLPADYEGPVYLKFRLYVTKGLSEDDTQRTTYGQWTWYGIQKEYDRSSNAGEADIYRGFSYTALPQTPEQIMGGIFNERELDSSLISPEGTVRLDFTNLDNVYAAGEDVEHASQFFQVADGPVLMIPFSSFSANYFRSVLVLMMQILIFAGLGCAAASYFSLPTAIFLVISYLLFGSFGSYMAESTFFSGTGDYIGYLVSKTLLLVVIPMQNFDVTGLVSDGVLVEYSVIGKLFLNYFVLRGMPFFLIGILCYWKRELGLVIRK